MNKKAESFKAYLDEKKIDVFTIEEIKDDDRETTVFRSFITVEGQQLPTIVIFDTSIYAIIRVQISPRAMTKDNTLEVLKLANDENEKYKPFKLYTDKSGNLLLDICFITEDDTVSGDTVYRLFDAAIRYLGDNYRTMMKAIW